MPPLVGVAVKVTEVPAHIAPLGLAAILTVGAALVVTDIVIAFEVSFAGEAQLAFDTIITVITSLLANVVEVYDEAVAPLMFTPFLRH